MTMGRVFEKPAPWGIGPGPAQLYSIEGAIAAIDTWLELTPNRESIRRERELMLALRGLLADMPQDVSAVDLQSAKRAIKGMVKYSRSREAEHGRIESYGQPSKLA
jgi:hypothetical protein